jgi:2-C-methyl-D-erythritol 2,4-cyclodiphosphate synthase
MSVRFEAPARKAIDFAMVEMERAGDTVFSSLHLLLGLLEPSAEGSQAALRLLGVNPAALQLDARRDLHLARTRQLTTEPDEAAELLLDRARRIAEQCGASAIADADILMAMAQDQRTWAARVLGAAGVSTPLLWGVFPEARGVLRPPGDPVIVPATPIPEPFVVPEVIFGVPTPAIPVRTGIGYDSHRFAAGGPLILAGVRIPGDLHLLGHSDADAVCHAVTDAILGGAALGDIGTLFPDTDDVNKGRDSIEMLRLSLVEVLQSGWRVAQVDVTVIAQRPKLQPYRDEMRQSLAAVLDIPVSHVGLKGKTNEGMGFIGRGEGLAVMAVATLVPHTGG